MITTNTGDRVCQCWRCGRHAKYSIPGSGKKGEYPSGWVLLEGAHMCTKCNVSFERWCKSTELDQTSIMVE